MHKFKAGDKVVAVKSFDHLTKPDRSYKIGDEFVVSSCSDNLVRFISREGSNYSASNFELAEDTSSYHPHHDLIVAWAKGAKIDHFSNDLNRWIPCGIPAWQMGMKYRVRPEKTEKELEIERIESEIRKLADDLNKLKGV